VAVAVAVAIVQMAMVETVELEDWVAVAAAII
jgi:hypothetical protein